MTQEVGQNANVDHNENTGEDCKAKHREPCESELGVQSGSGLREGFTCIRLLTVESCFYANSSIRVSDHLGLN